MRVFVGIMERGMVGVPFLYDVPADLEGQMEVGMFVHVPIGDITVRGCILAIFDHMPVDFATVPLSEPTQHPMLGKWPVQTCQWMVNIADRYYAPFHKVMRTFFPEKIWYGTYRPKRAQTYRVGVSQAPTPTLQKMVADVQERHVTKEELNGYSPAMVRKALRTGVLVLEEGALLPVQKIYTEKREEERCLTVEQQEIYDRIVAASGGEHLIHAVTGAGKTEVYVRLAQHMRDKGKQTIILVPEIALTPQLLTYFSTVFGSRIAVFHSHLTENEKCQEWVRVYYGDVDVVIGSRSALFAPCQRLGLVVVDEEHEWTYKNEQHPRYYTHQLLHMLVQNMADLTVVYGSATPSIELMYRMHPTQIHRLDLRIYEQTPSSRQKNIK